MSENTSALNAAPEPPVLFLEGVEKSYPSGTSTIRVLQGVDLVLSPGESVSIQGESGSGKTTLIHLAAALDRCDAGSIHWGGESLAGMARHRIPRERARRMGMVFQSFHLLPELTALENVLMGARLAGHRVRTMTARAEDLLEQVGLKDRMTHIPARLSGGEQQRVALARALINRPGMVLADEPTGNLDERTGEKILDLLLANCARENCALLLVTHNSEHALRTDRQLFLHLGRFEDRTFRGAEGAVD